jgi:branched-chain amino acid transport system permease protein
MNPQYWFFWIGLLLIFVVILLPDGMLAGMAQFAATLRARRIAWRGTPS